MIGGRSTTVGAVQNQNDRRGSEGVHVYGLLDYPYSDISNSNDRRLQLAIGSRGIEM